MVAFGSALTAFSNSLTAVGMSFCWSAACPRTKCPMGLADDGTSTGGPYGRNQAQPLASTSASTHTAAPGDRIEFGDLPCPRNRRNTTIYRRLPRDDALGGSGPPCCGPIQTVPPR
jgi:hypothetical protein